MAQVDAGMRIARRQERPFLPSPGQFVAWCKQSGGALGITVDQVIAEYWDWRNRSFEFTSSEQFPWSQPVMYHICVELRHRSTERQLTHGELAREAGDLLDMWEKRVTEGKPVPPVRRAIAAPAAEHGRRRSSCCWRSTTATSRTGWCEMTITIREQVLAALRNNPGLNNAKWQLIGMDTKRYRER
jgi:hypothetical protein